ncbi:hypothetical protein M6D93_17690 [Jatrophihabitans telluris]|uniref:Phage baseplate protein n=1 Tax=Jatrophihabitans telluris TaxID=2038343 RepID=A0ABY4QX54_9ACTN|nr:hypothetical protein [Jatrophihabitans telluris]UQX88105.1 hypothetical protein M6D93_17690 [Jatrophihabitans telluris]
MLILDERRLLGAWEAGLFAGPVQRALSLASAASGLPCGELARWPLGRLDSLLLDVRRNCFGSELTCAVGCPHCGDQLELVFAVEDLYVRPALWSQDEEAEHHVRLGDRTLRCRAVTSEDLLALPPDQPAELVRNQLATRCLLDPLDDDGGPGQWAEIERQLAELDPQSDLSVRLTCESCAHGWDAPFDIGLYLWAEVDAYARRLMYQVHRLATGYGWTEADVLAVGPARREFYLEAVPA